MNGRAKVNLKNLANLDRKIEDQIDDALGTVAHTAESVWKDGVRVDTGNYRNSIGPATRERKFLWSVSSPVDYGPYEELGTIHMRGSHAAAEATSQAMDDLLTILKSIGK